MGVSSCGSLRLRSVLGSCSLLLLLLYVTLCCWLFGTHTWPVQAFKFLPRFLRGESAVAADEEAAKAAVRAELGRGAWNMLHRMAATFDKAPTAARQRDVTEFFRLVGDLYPCEQCAAHFRGMLAASPVRAGSNRELSTWLCERHNEVNVRLGKPLFDCSLDSLKEKYGSCGCFGNTTTAGGGGVDEGSGANTAVGGKKARVLAARGGLGG